MPCWFLRLNGFEQFLRVLRLACEILLLPADGLGFLHAGKLLGGVFRPQVGVSVERDADLAVAHQVLERFRVYARLGLIAAAGMTADVGSDIVHLDRKLSAGIFAETVLLIHQIKSFNIRNSVFVDPTLYI